MAAESVIPASFVDQLIRASVVVGVAGPRGPEVGPAPPPDQILLLNPLGVVVLQGDPAVISQILAASDNGGEGLPPASKASIEALRTVDPVAEAAAEECPVCLDGLGAAVKEVPCGHRFHGGCIEKWLGMHGSCPVCRFRMPAEEEAGASRKRSRGEDDGDYDYDYDDLGDVDAERRRGLSITISFMGERNRHQEQGGNDGADQEEEGNDGSHYAH